MTTIRGIFVIAFLVVCSSSFAGPQRDQSIADRGDVNVVSFQEMEYPHLPYYTHLQGVVAVRVKLDEQGKVLDAVAISGLPLLAAASVENVKKWLFEPNATKAALIIYNYKILDGRCNHDSSLFILQGANVATVLACPPLVNPSTSGPSK
jgi:TonB-like protein